MTSDQKDAERYRKLRAMDWFDGPLAVVTRPKETVRPGTDCPSRERLDDLLDAIPAARCVGHGELYFVDEDGKETPLMTLENVTVTHHE